MSPSFAWPGPLGAVRAVADLAIPVGCAACGRPDDLVCASCRADVATCLWAAGPRAVRPQPTPQGLPAVHSTGRYAGALAAVVTAYKDDGRRDCAELLGGLLGRSFDAALAGCPELVSLLKRGDGPVLVVPVPSSAAARRSRGDAPLEALARAALAGFGPGEARLADALQPRRRVADQAGLGARARAVNLEHALVVRSRWEAVLGGASCVVVDDVLTTGATLVEATRALRAGGARVVVAATICATQRRSPRRRRARERRPARHTGGVQGTAGKR